MIAITRMDFHEYFPRMLAREASRNLWLTFERADVYIRIHLGYVDTQEMRYVQTIGIDIGNISMPKGAQHKGTFKRLILAIRAHTQLPIVLENVREDWAAHLVTRGWAYVPHSTESVVLAPGVVYPKPEAV